MLIGRWRYTVISTLCSRLDASGGFGVLVCVACVVHALQRDTRLRFVSCELLLSKWKSCKVDTGHTKCWCNQECAGRSTTLESPLSRPTCTRSCTDCNTARSASLREKMR